MDIGPCPGENTLLDFAGGLLGSTERARHEEHIDRCPSCQVILGRWLQSEGWESERRPPLTTGELSAGRLDAPELARGAALDRYVLLKPLGAGGMGLVFAAYDPLLDRTVAIKVLRHEVATAMPSSVRVRMLREARAMARLSHPNVVAVHDAGLFHGRVFIAMEYLEGGSLAEWFLARPRMWREIRDVFVKAGRGLAAAHARGLVHRDFKPQNVLFGADGAVKISDFGLVRPAESAETVETDPVAVLHTPAGERSVTATGAIVGTPGYIAPEQVRGETPDSRSDQYSFCAALHLALHGHLPGVPARSGPRRKLPDWLDRLVTRGLEDRPEARYASMEALLEELSSRDRRIRRRMAWLAALAAILLLSGGTAAMALRSPARCRDHDARLSRIWSPQRQSQVQARFETSQQKVARESWAHFALAIDQWAGGWSRQYAAACRAPETFGPVADCLDARLQELDALASALTSANDFMVREGAVRAVAELAAPSSCVPATSASPVPGSARARGPDTSSAVLLKLEAASDLYRSGEYGRALSAAEPLLSEARALGSWTLQARTMALAGKLRAVTQHHKDAAATLKQGMLAAIRADQPALACELAVEAAESLADQGQFEAADEYVELADALRPPEAPAIEARVLEGRATVRAVKGEWKGSAELYERALQLTREAYGDRHPQTAAVLLRLSAELLGGPDLERAQAVATEGYEIYESVYGPNHPDTLRALRKVIQAVRNRSDYQTERRLSGQILQIELTLNAADSVEVASARWYLGSALLNLGLVGAAREQFRDALVTYERTYAGSGEKDRQLAALYANVGSCHFDLGEDGEARTYLQRALDTHRHARGADDPKMCGYLAALGTVVASEGHLDQAELLYQQAITVCMAAGSDNGDLQYPHLSAAMSRYEAGHFKQAQESYQAARPIVQQLGTTGSIDLAHLEVGLAAAELAQGQVEAALARATKALETIERTVGPDQPLSAKVLTTVGEAYRQRGRPDLAIPYLERAERLRRAHGARPIERGETFLSLALALRSQGKSPERERSLLREARVEFTKSAWREVWLKKMEMRH